VLVQAEIAKYPQIVIPTLVFAAWKEPTGRSLTGVAT